MIIGCFLRQTTSSVIWRDGPINGGEHPCLLIKVGAVFFVWRADDVHQLLPKSMKSSMVVGFLGRGCSCRTPKDSGREDWGTLGNIREDKGNHHSGTLKNPIIWAKSTCFFGRRLSKGSTLWSLIANQRPRAQDLSAINRCCRCCWHYRYLL